MIYIYMKTVSLKPAVAGEISWILYIKYIKPSATIWDAPNQSLEGAVQSAKEYIDKMLSGDTPDQIAQRKQAAGATPARASSSSQVLTIDKMKNMSPQELMKIPKEVRNQALRGG